MNITKSIIEDYGRDPVTRLGKVPPRNQEVRQKESNIGEKRADQADTSSLGQLMSRSARSLQEALTPRAEVVARYRATLNEPVDLSDEVVKTIVRRMLGE
jgi:hypothetical protein